MRNKTDSPKVVSQDIQDLQAALGKTLRRYQSENASEIHSKHLLDMLKSLGTNTITTAPNTSQKNGLVECSRW